MPDGATVTWIKNVQDALAASSRFQTWSGTASSAAAKDKIHRGWRDEGDQPARPFVLLNVGAESTRTVAVNTSVWSGMLGLIAEKAVTSGNQASPEAAMDEARNQRDELLECLRELHGTEVNGVRLEIRNAVAASEIEFPEPAQGAATDKRYPYWIAMLEAELGVPNG